MKALKKHIVVVVALFSVILFSACSTKNKEKGPALFRVLDNKTTGLDFSNRLTATPDFNMLRYMYFYNGAGVGAADLNKDGLVDLFFAANQGRNRLYLNKGQMKFEDVTAAAGIPDDGGWSTGVSVADINNDGLMDIYVCRVGNYESLHSKNLLLLCQGIGKDGIPVYKDEAKEYGIDFSGFSTQAAFLDYDMDGDLDMFLLNHSLRYNSTFQPRINYNGTTDSLSGDYLFRNDGNHFTDLSDEAGILQTVIGYGLGVVVSDINMDGYPDIYIGNDFHENDYLYINNRKGGFTEELTQQINHTSQFSMGVDVADINNDAFPEIISVDMLPSDPYILRRSLGEDEYNTFQIKIRNGYNYQYARNTLQLNRQNSRFSDVGLYSGVAATDWSWAPLWIDFDNDGLKDLFISNGIPKRLNDIDYVNYISNDEIQSKIREGQMGQKDMALIDRFPEIKLPNAFFLNKGDALFEPVNARIHNDKPTFSNGAVYADFDNDGDIDIVVNNIDDPALVYQNTTNDKKDKPAIQLLLDGPAGNKNAVGAKLFIFSGTAIRSYEKYPVHGFQSSMEVPLQLPLAAVKADSVILVWPDNTCQRIQPPADTLRFQISYQKGLPAFDYAILMKTTGLPRFPVQDITGVSGLAWKHTENPFVEFDREPLIPFMLSQEGPALATGDINNDGLQDVFIGSSKANKSAVFIQQQNGFSKTAQPDIDNDSTYEDTGACWADFNGDGFSDLAVASGGNEYYGKSEFLLPRLYLNDGHGRLLKKDDAFSNIFTTQSCIVPFDFNGDGHLDLFVGGRAVPNDYGAVPLSCLLQNDGKGKFMNVTDNYSAELAHAGMVKDAVWADIDKDGDKDLVLALEWDGILAFVNEKGKFIKKIISNKKGWWNFLLPCDIDKDGDIDFIAGNQGLNSRLKADEKEPVRFYFYDFDGNGKKEQVISYYVGGKEIPFAMKSDLEKQLPILKKKFLYAQDFAKASMSSIFGKDKLKNAAVYSADCFANGVLINNGNLDFSFMPLPWQAQLTEYRDAAVLDINKDGWPDIWLAGNYYANNIQMGRYDADYGTLLVNQGGKGFACAFPDGFSINGEVRHVREISFRGKPCLLLAMNNDSLKLVKQPD